MSKSRNHQSYGVKVTYGKPQIVNSVVGADSKTKANIINVKGGTVDTCINDPVDVEGITSGVVAKIPVVLAELTLQLNVDSIITLPEPAFEIKDIKKRLKITQCLLLQNTNMLFIKGFVRKNIDYSTRNCSNSKGFCGDIRHCTIDVPFKCTTPIDFNGISPAPVVNSTREEFEYFREQDIAGPEFADKDKLLSGDLSEFNQVSTEYFNELPFCQLISSRIVEFDEYLNPQKPKKDKVPFEERQFHQVEEKMVIYLTFRILQKRPVAIGPVGKGPIRGCDED